MAEAVAAVAMSGQPHWANPTLNLKPESELRQPPTLRLKAAMPGGEPHLPQHRQVGCTQRFEDPFCQVPAELGE